MRKYFTFAKAGENIQRLTRLAKVLKHEPTSVGVCRDPKDVFMLALAQAAKADVLITGDEDLLVLKAYGRTKIITPAAFEKEYLAE